MSATHATISGFHRTIVGPKGPVTFRGRLRRERRPEGRPETWGIIEHWRPDDTKAGLMGWWTEVWAGRPEDFYGRAADFCQRAEEGRW